MNSTPPIDQLGTVLSVWAHPDDETYMAGGLMAAARDRGGRVVCAAASAGEHGTADPITWPPERLSRVRRGEAAVAMAVLGVDEHCIEHFPDGGLADHDDDGLEWVRDLIVAVRPDTILTFGPDGMTYHPDHIAVHRWVSRVWCEHGHRERLLYATPTIEQLDRFGELYERYDMFMTDERPTGVGHDDVDVAVRLEGADLDRKFAALQAMTTQTAAVIASLGPDRFRAMIATESFVAAAVSRASPRRGGRVAGDASGILGTPRRRTPSSRRRTHEAPA